MSFKHPDSSNNSFSFILDPSKSVTAAVRHLFSQSQAKHDRQFQERMLKHLIEAKLSLLLGTSLSLQYSTEGVADFLIEDLAIHVTTAPSEALIQKCYNNLDNGLKPIIITSNRSLMLAEELAYQADVGHRVDVLEAEQFLAGNIYLMGKFAPTGRRATVERLIYKYNTIVSDSKLRIHTTE